MAVSKTGKTIRTRARVPYRPTEPGPIAPGARITAATPREPSPPYRTVGLSFRTSLGRPIAACLINRPLTDAQASLVDACPLASPCGRACVQAIEAAARPASEAYGESSQANSIREIAAGIVAVLILG
jgi:hypothetical protein